MHIAHNVVNIIKRGLYNVTPNLAVLFSTFIWYINNNNNNIKPYLYRN